VTVVTAGRPKLCPTKGEPLLEVRTRAGSVATPPHGKPWLSRRIRARQSTWEVTLRLPFGRLIQVVAGQDIIPL
jgi:hypothetical protein